MFTWEKAADEGEEWMNSIHTPRILAQECLSRVDTSPLDRSRRADRNITLSEGDLVKTVREVGQMLAPEFSALRDDAAKGEPFDGDLPQFANALRGAADVACVTWRGWTCRVAPTYDHTTTDSSFMASLVYLKPAKQPGSPDEPQGKPSRDP